MIGETLDDAELTDAHKLAAIRQDNVKRLLANEQIVSLNQCWRCESEVAAKELEQWYFKITAYAERLLADMDKLVGWPEGLKTMQRNWIGRSEGAEVEFRIQNSESRILVFTTRPDTLFGATYMVLAPEHPFVAKLTVEEQRPEVEAYVAAARRMSEAAAPAMTVGWRKTMLVTAMPSSKRLVTMAQLARVWNESMELRWLSPRKIPS